MAEFDFEKPLKAEKTNIPGMLVFDLAVHGDSRGWFKENWQRAKQTGLGLPDLGPVQNNISFNAERGVTRGIHAEPWDKYISVATGSVFGAWVDLRPGKSFGEVYTCVIDPSKAVYVPRGVGNSFQALEDGTAYTYLVNAHWSAELKKTYTFVNLADPELGIDWPIPLSECELSEADKRHPMLKDAIPMAPRRTLVTGANGQLGRAVRKLAEERGLLDCFDFADRDEFDFSDADEYSKIDWTLYGTVINCGAYTAVDAAEAPEGRRAAWAANAQGPALLAKTCAEHGITLVHVSSDYVFDGTQEEYAEGDSFSPLGVYGQTKAAGDIAVSNCPRHYIVRSSWVIGEGKNFVRTMAALSDRCADPEDKLNQVTVVNDQLGRLTFTRDMAEGIFWLLGYREGDREPSAPCDYGTYNLTGSGKVASWADIAAKVFDLRNGNANAVKPVTTAEYYAGAKGPISPRPVHSALDFSKLEGAGFVPHGWEEELSHYSNQTETGAPVVRVLQVTSKLFRGGAEAFIMNVNRNVDRTQVQFDFLVFHAEREYYEDEIERLGGHVYHVPIMEGVNLLRRKRMLGAFFDEHCDYVAVHCHMAALGRDVLRSAAEHGIERRFSHSHIADFERTPRNIVKQAFQKGFGECATKRLACSRTAGEFMYPGKDFEVVNNGIEVARFAFDAARRDAFRASHGFSESDRLVGHVGRFELMKNHGFLIDVFAALACVDEHAHLVLAGDGSLRQDVEKKVNDLGLAPRVHFLGLLDDMPSFYDGVDCFAMPSLFEGLPFSAVEAQCSGLPCLLSGRITDEVAVTDLVEYLPLEAGAEAWADGIERALEHMGCLREGYAGAVADAGFDIKAVAADLTELYVGR